MDADERTGPTMNGDVSPHDPEPDPRHGVAVTRSEERVRAGTTLHPTSTVRFGKRIVTEEVAVTVTVRREEFYIEQAAAGDAVATGTAAGPREYEVVLRREVPVVTTAVEGVEVVRVHTVLVGDTAVVVPVEVSREVVEVDPVERLPG